MTATTTELVGLLVSVVLPLLVGLVTKASTSSGVKAVILAVLAAITGVAITWQQANSNGISWDWKTAVIAALISFLVAVGTHFGFWKPTLVTAAAQSSLNKD